MKRYGLIALALILSLVIPVSVYAYNNSETTSDHDAFNIHETHHQNSNMMMHGDMPHDTMHEMMNNETIDCDNETMHNTYVEEQKALIQKDLSDNKINQDEADQRLQDLNDMLEQHDNYHQDNQEDQDEEHTNSCH